MYCISTENCTTKLQMNCECLLGSQLNAVSHVELPFSRRQSVFFCTASTDNRICAVYLHFHFNLGSINPVRLSCVLQLMKFYSRLHSSWHSLYVMQMFLYCKNLHKIYILFSQVMVYVCPPHILPIIVSSISNYTLKRACSTALVDGGPLSKQHFQFNSTSIGFALFENHILCCNTVL